MFNIIRVKAATKIIIKQIHENTFHVSIFEVKDIISLVLLAGLELQAMLNKTMKWSQLISCDGSTWMLFMNDVLEERYLRYFL